MTKTQNIRIPNQSSLVNTNKRDIMRLFNNYFFVCYDQQPSLLDCLVALSSRLIDNHCGSFPAIIIRVSTCSSPTMSKSKVIFFSSVPSRLLSFDSFKPFCRVFQLAYDSPIIWPDCWCFSSRNALRCFGGGESNTREHLNFSMMIPSAVWFKMSPVEVASGANKS